MIRFRWALPMVLLACLALPAAVGAQTSLRDDINNVQYRIDRLVERLAGSRTVSRTDIRAELAAISDDLDDIKQELGRPGWQGGYGRDRDRDWEDGDRDWDGDWDRDDRTDRYGWVPYAQAESYVQPSSARFDGWERGRTFSAQTTRSRLSLTINNGDYRATWTIRGDFSGNPRVTVSPQSSGDLQVIVRTASSTREFLVSNGGLGPIYVRSGGDGPSFPPRDGQTRMVWVTPYYDQIQARQITRSPGMDWFISQVETGRYVVPELEVFGRYLVDIPDEIGGDIAVLRYNSGAGTKTMVISDPRNSLQSFMQAINKAYAVYQSGGSISIELR